MLLPVRSVGVMGDSRSYESALCIRAVSSVDAMTAEASELPLSDLGRLPVAWSTKSAASIASSTT